MTVTVTKVGTPPTAKILSASCRNCRCEFTFAVTDAVRVHDQRDGDYYCIGCPTCGIDVTKSVKA